MSAWLTTVCRGAAAALGVALVAVAGCARSPLPARIGGGGATSIEPLINTWQPVYFAHQQVQVDYIGAGSGNGVQQMIRRAILFGCTDAPLNEEQLAAARAIGGEVVHLPLAISGIVPICRVPGVPDGEPLRFSGPVLAAIFLGEMTRWNDPALQALNPGVALPDLPIKVVSRSEPSGTTAIFAEYLERALPGLWQSKNMGRGPGVAFAVGIRQKGNPGVAGEVLRNLGAIGYVELTYAMQMNRAVSFGAVRNRDGRYILATPASITAAAASMTIVPDNLCFSLIDTPGSNSYPICGANWAVFYQRQLRDSGPLLIDFLRWATSRHGGQTYAPGLGYAPLPDGLIERAHTKLGTVQFD